MADYNNAVVYYDNSGIEYANHLKKTLERGFERECYLINLDSSDKSDNSPSYALKTSKYVIFLFTSIFPNDQMYTEAKSAFDMEKCVISLKLKGIEHEKPLKIYQTEFEDNYELSKKINSEFEKLKQMSEKGVDFVEACIRFNLGNIYFNFKKYDEAIRDYKKAVKSMPDFAEALHNLNSLSKLKLSEIPNETYIKPEVEKQVEKKEITYKSTKIDELIPNIFSKADSEKNEIVEVQEPVEEISSVPKSQEFEEEPDSQKSCSLGKRKLSERINVKPVTLEKKSEIIVAETFMIESMKPKEIKEDSNELDEANVSEVKIDTLSKNTDKEEVLENVKSAFIENTEDIKFEEEPVEVTEVLEKEKPEMTNDIESYTYAPKETLKSKELDIVLEESKEECVIVDIADLEECLANQNMEIQNLEEVESSNFERTENLESANKSYEAGDLEKAEEEYLNVIKNNPNNSEAHNNYGCLLEQLEKYDEAEIEFKKAVNLDENNSKAHNNLATLLGKSEKYVEAEKHYKKAIEINPCYWEAMYNLGAMYASLKRYDDAISQVKSMIKIFRSEGNIKEVLELKKLVKHLKKLQIQNYKK